MEIDQRMIRELQKKFEMEMNKKEIEMTEAWRKDLETIYKKKYENLNSLLNDIRILTKIVKEGA
jgi:hypothetical protein